MKRHLLATAAIACVGAILVGSRYDLSTTAAKPDTAAPVSAKAPAPVPIGTIPVGQIAQLTFPDLTADVARKSHLGYYPRPTGSISFPAVGLDGNVAVFFSSPTAAKVLVWIDSPSDGGKVQHAEMEVTVGTPEPTPTPDPVPPPPDPVPVAQKIQIVVIEESADSTSGLARIRNSKAISDWADAGGHRVFFVDIDSAKAAGGTWATWATRAAGKPLPYAFISPVAGGDTLKETEAPATPDAFLALAKRYGGEGTGCPNGTCPTRKAVPQ
jgi:hypothetical protein